MDPATLVGNILGVAKALLELAGRLTAAGQNRKEKTATLFENISGCLAEVSSEIRRGDVPYGRCHELMTYAQELPDLIRAEVGDEKADELGRTLYSAHDVEAVAMGLIGVQNKEPCLSVIEEASGKFRAIANMVRAR